MEYIKARCSYLRTCWEHAKHHWAMAALIFIVAAYSLYTEYAEPFVAVPSLVLKHKLPLSWALIVFLAGLFFIAVEGGYRIKEKLREPNGVPELFLKYVQATQQDFIQSDKSGFFLQTQGERQAANVRITSEDSVGHERARLIMKWDSPLGYVGNQEVPVGLTCISIKDGKEQFRGAPSEQIHVFFDQKRDEPKELIVTVGYTDIAGHECPAKRFRVFIENDRIARLYGTAKVDCQPLPP